jgi:cytochrome bd-type quinol oxidase subunit 2
VNPYPYPYAQPDPAAIRSKDEADLNLLSTLHYVWTGFLGCMSLGLVGYFIAIAAFVAKSARHARDAETVAAMMTVFAVVFTLMFIPMIILHLYAAAGMKKRTRYWLAFVMACLACTSVPLGTALGIWTIMVLQRPSVKALFGKV